MIQTALFCILELHWFNPTKLLVSPVCFSLKGGMQTALSSQALEVLIRKKRLQKAITARRPRYLQGGKMCFGFFQNEGGDPQTRKSSFEWGIKIESWSLGYTNPHGLQH
jgi:hypothetical protein